MKVNQTINGDIHMSTSIKALGASILIMAALPAIAHADAKKSAAAHALLALQSGSEYSNLTLVGPTSFNNVRPIQVYATPASVRPVQGSASVPAIRPDETTHGTIITDLPKQVWASPI
jgi:hypothetical protein